MSRSFRVYEKKRGARRTGSKVLGSAGEALFFACILGIGTLVLVLLLKRLVIPEWRANHAFQETTCTVLRVLNPIEVPDDDGPTYIPLIEIEYEVGGERYVSEAYDIATKRGVKLVRRSDEAAARDLVDDFVVGKSYPCWFDPTDPATVVVVRGYTWWLWALLLLPVAFIGIAGAGLVYTLIHWGKSSEHRAATRIRSPQLDSLDPAANTARNYPYIPNAANLTNSPGTTLKYRLPIHSAYGWRLFAASIICVLWNTIVFAFIVMAISSFVAGEPDWQLVLFTVPFLAGGIGLVYLLFRQSFAAAGPGPTHVEVCSLPFLPGQNYRIVVTQAGSLKVKSLTIVLACDEEVSFYQGTDVRTERRRAVEEEVHRWERFEVTPGTPFQGRCEVPIPQNAMHSFQAENNEIQWKLIVKLDIENWHTVERVFPVIVYPQATESVLV